MGNSYIVPFLLSLFIFSLFQIPSYATKKSYIVYLGANSFSLKQNSVDLDSVTNSHYDLLGSCLGSNEKAKEAIFYSYRRCINGFAAMLDEEAATELSKNPNVVSVFLNQGRKLHTTRSWDFMGLEENEVVPSASTWNKARFGDDTIIGNLDTGVWPESKSFSDEGMSPVPSKWRGRCQHDTKNGVYCNRKLIGAKYFNKGYLAYLRSQNATSTISQANNSTLFTPRDYKGHGTHTLSTAGGNFVPGASVFGYGNGTAKGGSPKARVAAYKVCWPSINGNECFDADIMAGFEAAISDGVDVISVSLGGQASEFFKDGISIGAFHAVKNGISVITSAGNDGPISGSISNVAPWMFTVGASTIDRQFTNFVLLANEKKLEGTSISSKSLLLGKFFPLISAADAKNSKASHSTALLCKNQTLDPKKARGKIVICVRGENDRTEKGLIAANAGAVGMILVNDEESGNEIIADPHVLPTSHINYSDGNYVFSYINSTKTPMAFITRVKTEIGTKPAPFMAAFSSRGPNPIEEAILKPDVTAPGVNIIAAYTEAVGPIAGVSGKLRVPFITESGTSMSCPHISGIVGLLKTLHPDWSPAAIKSAIMTTAKTRDNKLKPILDSTKLKATPFAYGSGHVQPNHAMEPGLVYDLTEDDYLNFLCARGYNQSILKIFSNKPYTCPKSFSVYNLNYPSISVPNLREKVVILTRRLKNVGSPGSYKASVKAPDGVSVSVKPKSLKFNKIGEEKEFKVILREKVVGKPEEYAFGELKWSDGKHVVRSPIAVKS